MKAYYLNGLRGSGVFIGLAWSVVILSMNFLFSRFLPWEPRIWSIAVLICVAVSRGAFLEAYFAVEVFLYT